MGEVERARLLAEPGTLAQFLRSCQILLAKCFQYLQLGHETTPDYDDIYENRADENGLFVEAEIEGVAEETKVIYEQVTRNNDHLSHKDVNWITEMSQRFAHVGEDLEAYNKASLDLHKFGKYHQILNLAPDLRPKSQTYIQKEDVDYCTYEVAGVQKVCCRTVALAIANQYIGASFEECNVESFTTYYFRTCRFNMSQEQKLTAAAGTIEFATHVIREVRKELGLPFNEGVPTITRNLQAFSSAVNSLTAIANQSKSWLSLPARILSGGVKLAGLVYGHFGVRKMRPLKQDF